jgi:ABC-type nitrate/sulfonate/bicarbonate transport system permease component
MKKKLPHWSTLISLPLFFCGWQLICAANLVNPLLFPPPTKVAVALFQYLTSADGWLDIGSSVGRAVIGYVAGAFAGIAFGMATGTSRIANGLLTPIFQMLRPIPPIAFVPIVIVWFGLSELGKWFLVFWGVFFAVWLATHMAMSRGQQTLVRAAQSLGAQRMQLLWNVQFPEALPTIFVGLRSSIMIAFYTLVSAELAGAYAGVAYRLAITQQNLQIAQMMAGLLVLGFMSMFADRMFERLSRRVIHWTS